MNSIKKKLTSQSGASITYALLIFLVCAVVSSIVLAAATAASGRISGSVSSDQRYYSVTSAAQLLKKELDGKSNTIKIVTIGDSTTTTIDGEAWNSSDTHGIIKDASAIVGGLKTSPGTVVLDYSIGDKDSLKVQISETVDITSDPNNPKLKLNLSNNESGKEGTYTLCLTFTAGIDEQPGVKKKVNGEIENTTTKKITWNYYSIETVAATTAASGGGS